MLPWRIRPLLLASLLIAFLLALPSLGTGQDQWKPAGEPPAPTTGLPAAAKDSSISIEAVIVHPYRSANVGSQVAGEVKKVHFEEGDRVSEGAVVVEIQPTRYVLLVQRAEQRLRAHQAALERVEEEVALKSELLSLDASTRQDVAKLKADAEIARHRVAEAERELDLALLDLQNCKVKAPFTGYLAVRYKQPYESVERLEKVFSIMDSSKVHAVANVREELLPLFKKGTGAVFVSQTEEKYQGTVDRIGKLIDPKSKTTRVHILLDNANGKLEVGTTGSVYPVKSGDP